MPRTRAEHEAFVAAGFDAEARWVRHAATFPCGCQYEAPQCDVGVALYAAYQRAKEEQMKLDLQLLRYRAASKMSLCAGHHEIHRADDGNEVWVECNGEELNRLNVEDWAKAAGLDVSHQVQLFIREVMFEHEQDVVGKVVIELLDRLEQAEAS